MMCLHVLLMGATSCLDRVVHAIPVVDALPTISPRVDIFHADPSHSRDSVEPRVRRKCLMNRVDVVQLGGHVTNPEDPYTVVRDRGCKARHVRQNRLATVSDRTRWRAKLEESWRPTTLALVMRDRKSQSLLAYVADLARDHHRRGGRVVLTFRWFGSCVTFCFVSPRFSQTLVVAMDVPEDHAHRGAALARVSSAREARSPCRWPRYLTTRCAELVVPMPSRKL